MGFMREAGRSSDVGGLLLLSLLVMLNLPLAFPLWMGMDQYGLYTVDAIAGVRHLPLALAAIISTSFAFLGYYAYKGLRARPDHPLYREWRAFYRHIFVIGAPVAMAKLPAFVLTFDALKPYFIVAGVLVTASLSVVALLRESDIVTSAGIAAAYSVTVILVTLTMVAMSIALLLVVFPMELIPPTGNFVWEWRFDWADMYYRPEDFVHRTRVALVFFGVTACVYMAAAMGYAMLEAIYTQYTRIKAAHAVPSENADTNTLNHAEERWTVEGVDRNEHDNSGAHPSLLGSLPSWGVEVLERLGWRDGDAQDYFVAFDGEEVGITASQYDRLITHREDMLSEADLLVDKCAPDVYAKIRGRWERIRFRGRGGTRGRFSGPLALLCVCARNPRHRFETIDLRRRLEDEMRGSGAINVSDFRNQLKSRRVRLDDGRRVEAIPLEYDGRYTFIRDETKVCFIYDK